MSKTEIPLTSDPDRRLFYNSKTGLVELTENDGKTLLFQDGDWTYRGKTDIPQETRDQIFETVKSKVKDTQEAAGGNANKAITPGWIKTSKENFDTGDDAKLSETNREENNYRTPKSRGGQGNTDGHKKKYQYEEAATELSPHTGNIIKELMKSAGGYLNYPNDAIYSGDDTGYNQDHVRITQYTYRPPRSSMVKTSTGTKSHWAATQGNQRTSALKAYHGMVKLPMPSDVSDSNNVSWGEDQMNNISAAITGYVGANMGLATGAKVGGDVAKFMTGLGSGDAAVTGLLAGDALMGGALSSMTKGPAGATLRATLQSRILAGQGVNVSPESILARGLGVVPNANLELLFNSPTLREFQFSWKMTPRSKQEAKTVRNIIRFFKQGMAARKLAGKAGKKSLWLGTPNVFHVQYKTNEELDIEGVNKIKTVAVTGCAINYTPDGVWSAYEDGQPTSTVMSLRMQELEPVYDTDYSTDIMKDRLFNDDIQDGGKVGGGLYKVGINEVGY